MLFRSDTCEDGPVDNLLQMFLHMTSMNCRLPQETAMASCSVESESGLTPASVPSSVLVGETEREREGEREDRARDCYVKSTTTFSIQIPYCFSSSPSPSSSSPWAILSFLILYLGINEKQTALYLLTQIPISVSVAFTMS